MSIEHTIQAINATTDKYLKRYVDLTLRKRFVPSYLQKAGRIVTGESGPNIVFKVKARHPRVVSTSGSRSDFQTSDVYETLTIGHGQLRSTSKLDRETLMINKGETQIINLADEMAKDCSDALGKAMSENFYVDNTSDAAQLTGLQTIIRADVGANTDRVAVPAAGSEYGGKSMVLGALGGRWSANLGTGNYLNTKLSSALQNDWPEGQGDPQYDYLAPKMFNYTGSWSAANNSWETNCEKVMRRAHVAINALGGEGVAPAVHILAPGLYTAFQDSVQDRERLHPSDYAAKMGFSEMMNYAGALLAYDYDCPAGTGYALNPQELALCSLNDKLFYTDGPTWDIQEGAYLFLIGFAGNYRWQPKYIASYGSYTV